MAISFLLFVAAFVGALLAFVGVIVLLVTKKKVFLPLIAIGLSVLTAAIGTFVLIVNSMHP